MTDTRSSRRNQFIELMAAGGEQAEWGFAHILKRDDFPEFFDELRLHGLFAAKTNSGPVSVDEGKYVRIPYWAALDYLVSCAKFAAEKHDLLLASKVLEIVREVSRDTETRLNSGSDGNYHTNRRFAEILGFVPLDTVKDSDIDLIAIWLKERFQRGLVAHALDRGLMKRLLASDVESHWSLAVRVLLHCTALEWIEEVRIEGKTPIARTVVDDHWLKELIKHHSPALGTRAGRDAVEVFVSRLRELSAQRKGAMSSSFYRPAVEDHAQNHQWNGPHNRFIEGLRDVAIAWTDTSVNEARAFVVTMLQSNEEIVRRVGIYLLDTRWVALRPILGDILSPALFNLGHLHELYNLLAHRFELFSEAEKSKTVDSIRGIHLPANRSSSEDALRRVQLRWLSAVSGRGSQVADSWRTDLQSDPSLGGLSDHPDFTTYSEFFQGPGPTPFAADQLVEFARSGLLVEHLNSFVEEPIWRGPTKSALVDALEAAVQADPLLFLSISPTFAAAQRPYQFALINGLKRVWESPDKPLDPKGATKFWEAALSLFETLVNDAAFWQESVAEDHNLTPTRDWIPPLIADFLRSGTRSDERAYPPSLLTRSWEILRQLVERAAPLSEAGDDPMTEAINSAKGRIVEALYSHALYACRTADKVSSMHVADWEAMRPLLDRELQKCTNANFEFSTLTGSYLANALYLSSDWVKSEIRRIFPRDFVTNFRCAIAGLAYAPATRPLFLLLSDAGVLDAALSIDLKEEDVRERLVERIALAYVWGDEPLDSPRFEHFFRSDTHNDLRTIARFLVTAKAEEIDDEQVERILAFWRRCMDWSSGRSTPPATLLASLSRLAIFLTTIDVEKANWLKEVAPYAHGEHDGYEFIEQLLRIADTNADAARDALRAMLEKYVPSYDYDDRLQELLRSLAAKGFVCDAMVFADRLRSLPQFPELYTELTQTRR